MKAAKRDTANLQSPRVTVKEAARIMNVSERSVYMARAVERLRPDLAERCAAGRMSINKAHKLATGRKVPDGYDRLVRAWNAASPEEQGRFLVAFRKAIPL